MAKSEQQLAAGTKSMLPSVLLLLVGLLVLNGQMSLESTEKDDKKTPPSNRERDGIPKETHPLGIQGQGEQTHVTNGESFTLTTQVEDLPSPVGQCGLGSNTHQSLSWLGSEPPSVNGVPLGISPSNSPLLTMPGVE